MQKYRVTEETPTRLGIRIKEGGPVFLFAGVVFICFGLGVFAMSVTLLGVFRRVGCLFGVGLSLTIFGIVLISQSTYDWTFNKEDGTVIHTTSNLFRQAVVKQYNLRDIQHAFVDEDKDDENSNIVYKSLALKHTSGETIRLMRSYGKDKENKELVDRINAWMRG